MKMWYREDSKAPAEIARLLHRNKATISHRLRTKVTAEQQGAKRVLTLAQVDHLTAKTKVYFKHAMGRYRITYQIIKNRTRCKASVKTIMREFLKRGITFRKMREKPLLTDEDIADRFRFGRKHKGKLSRWWLRKIDDPLSLPQLSRLPHVCLAFATRLPHDCHTIATGNLYIKMHFHTPGGQVCCE